MFWIILFSLIGFLAIGVCMYVWYACVLVIADFINKIFQLILNDEEEM